MLKINCKGGILYLKMFKINFKKDLSTISKIHYLIYRFYLIKRGLKKGQRMSTCVIHVLMLAFAFVSKKIQMEGS